MNANLLIYLLGVVAMVILGFLVSYFKTKTKVLDSVASKIAEAEEIYKDTTKAGGKKFNYCVEYLYSLVPSAFTKILTKEVIGTIVQGTFDSISSYAKIALDKVVK